MEQVAGMLGVDMGERFNITHKIDGHIQRDDYYFTEEGLMREGFRDSHRKSLSDLLTGKIELIKKPWKPRRDEYYWHISSCGIIENDKYSEHTFDIVNIIAGNCFKTLTEAEAHRDEIMAKFKAVME
jgi:hypothetical protein